MLPSDSVTDALTLFRQKQVMLRAIIIIFSALFSLELAAAPAFAQDADCIFCDIPKKDRAKEDQKCFRGDGSLKPGKKGCEKFYDDPIELTIETDLDFGRLIMIGEGRGSVLIDVETGTKTVMGDLDDLGGIAMAGEAVVQGAPNRAVQIDLPATVTLRDPAGGQAELREFRTDLPALPMLDENGRLKFNFTGTLYTGDAITIGGNLRGRVPISVDYD